MSDELVRDSRALSEQALTSRTHGEFNEAAILYASAARLADDPQQKLFLMMRGAHCLWATDLFDEAVQVATNVADQARTEMHFPELADAVGMLVDHAMLVRQFTTATELLGEAMYVMERVPNEPANYHAVHNMGVTYQRADFPVPALELFDRALRLVDDENDRTYTYANMASAYHLAYLLEDDRAVAEQHLRNGIYAANAVLDPQADAEVLSVATARSHRAMLYNYDGNYDAALVDAEIAISLTQQHSLSEELAVGMLARAYVHWRRDQNPAALDEIISAWTIAREFGIEIYLRSGGPIAVEILWAQGRYDEARAALEGQLELVRRGLRHEQLARWEHVKLGVSHRTTEAISESDPLTGLANRRYLGRWLPDVLDQHVPVCVAVLDLDGFKQVNDDYSYAHGDRVLQELAGILQRVCRRGDAVVRLGGDEFVIVLRDTSPGDARAVLERVRQLIAVRTWEGLPSTVTLTASVGVAVGVGAVNAPLLLSSASAAMQSAKRGGRDRIVFC